MVKLMHACSILKRLFQFSHSYTRNLNSETSEESKSAFSHCRDVLGREASSYDSQQLLLVPWATWYSTWLLVKLTPKGVVFPFLFL